MSWILDRACASLLRPYQRDSALLVFDYEGTLAPVGIRRSPADMRPTTTRRLRVLAANQCVAILTQCSRSEVVRRLDRVPVVEVIGDNGAEASWRVEGTAPMPIPKKHDDVERDLKCPASLAIMKFWHLSTVSHQAGPCLAVAPMAMRRIPRTLESERMICGKYVPHSARPSASAPDEQVALSRLRRRLGDPPTLYVSSRARKRDDFRPSLVKGVLQVGVGPLDEDGCYFLHDQGEIDAFLQRLVAGHGSRAPLAVSQDRQGP